MNRHNYFLPDRQVEFLKDTAQQVDIRSSAELLRRIIDFAAQPGVMNQIIPAMSGQIQVRS